MPLTNLDAFAHHGNTWWPSSLREIYIAMCRFRSRLPLVVIACATHLMAGAGWSKEARVRQDAEVNLAPSARLWTSQHTPTNGPARVIGASSGGCLLGGVNLPAQGTGHWSVRPARATHYGHTELIAYIQDLAARAHAAQLPALPIGDLSLPRGGPYPAQHRSHQSGLDVDIYFWRLDGRLVRPPLRSWQWATIADPPREGPWRPTPLRSERIELLRLAAEDQRVDAVLVNPQIKLALCRRVQGDRSWLSRIQPFWGHERHFHVRLRCPPDSPECVEKPLPAPKPHGEGCGDDLSWWFGPQSREGFLMLKSRDLNTRGRNLPPACDRVPEPSRRSRAAAFHHKSL